MPPIDAALITAIAVIVGGIVTAWIGLRRLRPEIAKLQGETVNLKAEGERLKAESEKLKAEAELARAQRDAAEAEALQNISDTVNRLLGPLNREICLLREGREKDRDRIRKLEANAAVMGQENIELKCKVESLETQNETLRSEIISLRRIIDDFRSGRRKPTGPLEE